MKWIKVDEAAYYVDEQDVDLFRDLENGGWILDVSGRRYKFISAQHAQRAYDQYVKTGLMVED